MRILAIETALRGGEVQFTPVLLREEAAVVWAWQQRDVIREIWFTAPGRRAVILLECTGVDEARRVLATLPLVREGGLAFELHALGPYDGFERLFARAGER